MLKHQYAWVVEYIDDVLIHIYFLSGRVPMTHFLSGNNKFIGKAVYVMGPLGIKSVFLHSGFLHTYVRRA